MALLLAAPLTVSPSWADEHEGGGGWIAKARERVSSAVGRLGQLEFGGGRFYVGLTGGQTMLDLDDGVAPSYSLILVDQMDGVTISAADYDEQFRREALDTFLGLGLSRDDLMTRFPDPIIGSGPATAMVAESVNGNLSATSGGDFRNIQFGSGEAAATTVHSKLDDDADSSFKFYAGYQLNDMVAVEAFYVDHGSYDVDVTYTLGAGHVYRDRQAATINTDPDTNIYVDVPISGEARSSLSYDSTAFGVTVPIGWQVHANVRAFVKVGLTFWDVEVDEEVPGDWNLTVGGAASALTLVSDNSAVTNATAEERATVVQTALRQATGSTTEVTAMNVDTASASFTRSDFAPSAALGMAESLDLDEEDDGVGFHFGVGADFGYGNLPLNIRMEYEGWTSDPVSGNFSIGLHYLF